MGIQDGEQGKYIIRPTPQTTQVSRGEQSSYASRKSEGALKEGDPQDWGIACVQVCYNAYQLAKGGNAQGRFAKNCKRGSRLLRKQIAEHFSAKFSTTELILQSRVCVETRWQNLHCCSKGFGKQIRIQAGNPLCDFDFHSGLSNEYSGIWRRSTLSYVCTRATSQFTLICRRYWNSALSISPILSSWF